MEQKTTARDVFLYLLVIITLGIAAGNLWVMLYQFVNIYVPDPAIQQCYGTSCRDTIRFAMASLIVVFPVLVWAWRFLQRDIVLNPEKADSRVRRWLLYFTLFVAAVIMIGDAVALLWSWLQGDLTLQFFLKVLAVLYIFSSIFYYFLKALHPEERGFSRAVAWTAVVVVLACIVGGFITSGSPFRARAERLDTQRITDLSNIQASLIGYWQKKGKLPDALTDLEDPISGYVNPVDPVTKQSYEYIRKTDLTFVLCASFGTAQDLSNPGIQMTYPAGGQNQSWSHAAGRVCFDRAIDPQLYRVESPIPLPVK